MVTATEADAARLYALRMDWTVVDNSRTRERVSFQDHLTWLAGAMVDPTRRLYIVWRWPQRLGSARLDQKAGVVELSLTLAQWARGQGLAVPVIQALCRQARREFGPGRLLAVVREHHMASLRAFWDCEFRPVPILLSHPDYGQYGLVHLAREAPEA